MKRDDYNHYKNEIQQIMLGKHPFNLGEKFMNGLECLGAVKRFYDSCDDKEKSLLRKTIIEMLDSSVLNEKEDAIGLSEELKIEEAIPKLLKLTTSFEILNDVSVCITLASALATLRVNKAKPFFLSFLHHYDHPEAFDWRDPDKMEWYKKENPSICVTPISLIGLVSVDLDAALEYIHKFFSWDTELLITKDEWGYKSSTLFINLFCCFMWVLKVYGEESLYRVLEKIRTYPDIQSKREFVIGALTKTLNDFPPKWVDDKKKKELIEKAQETLS
ncbi:MAG: hypothetical protein U9Q21_02320 [Candidatus Auribacterota bacterium]|nr:hypothetical protein [Candidatus Auribacterota bacterium]